MSSLWRKNSISVLVILKWSFSQTWHLPLPILTHAWLWGTFHSSWCNFILRLGNKVLITPHWFSCKDFKVLLIYTLGGILPWRWCCLAPPTLLVLQVRQLVLQVRQEDKSRDGRSAPWKNRLPRYRKKAGLARPAAPLGNWQIPRGAAGQNWLQIALVHHLFATPTNNASEEERVRKSFHLTLCSGKWDHIMFSFIKTS